MPSTYKTPGVYIEEISKFPPSIAEVATAIPAFIGYTQKAIVRGVDYHKVAADAQAAADDAQKKADTSKTAADAAPGDENLKKAAADAANAAQVAKAAADASIAPVPVRITSLLEYEVFFGTALPETSISVTVTNTDVNASIAKPSPHNMYYALQAYFANGGGSCYIVSVGQATATGTILQADLKLGLDAVEKEDEVTLIVFPESLSLILDNLSNYADYAAIYDAALAQCNKLQDRFVVMDVLLDPNNTSLTDASDVFRSNGIGINNLKYGAAYGPRLETIFNYIYKDQDVDVTLPGESASVKLETLDPKKKPAKNGQFYPLIQSAIDRLPVVLPAAPIVVGVYAAVDNSRGVWKAPANVSLSSVIQPTIKITNAEQEDLNVHTTGKSINAIRAFTGKGTLIWGSRTLDGNSNEWRYVPVRRFFNMAEESIKKATEGFVFEPNDANTWVKVKAMIENFLTLQWRAGALAGAKPEQAFYVNVGLNTTMTALDILEGRMIIEIGMAVVRPAEFIILKFSHKMQES
jgi:uncharacterized protein